MSKKLNRNATGLDREWMMIGNLGSRGTSIKSLESLAHLGQSRKRLLLFRPEKSKSKRREERDA